MHVDAPHSATVLIVLIVLIELIDAPHNAIGLFKHVNCLSLTLVSAAQVESGTRLRLASGVAA